MPSNQDTNFTLTELQNDLKVVRQPLVRAREKWGILGEERDARNIQRLEASKYNLLRNEEKIRLYKHYAGNLWACSGYRIHPLTEFGLDWALVRLPDHHTMLNLISLLSTFFSSLFFFARAIT
jgi:hypothetical protein